eukprot:TRINITY_DN52270_c0_g1_i1.p1 TRINITY_DN52270_c0_g1~~TRINITY_DN52270_c0_g1_i1.p1  ORF type:complete len:306 (+),score=73.39 TRINITY_DN52270_c0_g1_i1:68-985(+)
MQQLPLQPDNGDSWAFAERVAHGHMQSVSNSSEHHMLEHRALAADVGDDYSLSFRRSQPERLTLMDNIKRNRRRLRASDDWGQLEELDRQSRRIRGQQRSDASSSSSRTPRGTSRLPPAAGVSSGDRAARGLAPEESEDWKTVFVGTWRKSGLQEDDADEPMAAPPQGRSPREVLAPLQSNDETAGSSLEPDAAAPAPPVPPPPVAAPPDAPIEEAEPSADLRENVEGTSTTFSADVDSLAAGRWVKEAMERLQEESSERGLCWECRAPIDPGGGICAKGFFCRLSCFGSYVLHAAVTRRQQEVT